MGEARGKIAQIFKPYIVKRPKGQCQILFALTELDTLTEAIVRELGYHKLPKDKPPLLNDGEITRVEGEGMDVSMKPNPLGDIYRAIAQAQRETDIKWYEQ